MTKKLLLLGLASATLAAPLALQAAQFRAEEQPTLASGENVQGNLYMAGGNVSSSGNVRGDLMVAGGNIILSGPISNDLLAGGGPITVTSDVGGDVRVGGGNITVQGKVAGDVVIGGGQITIAGVGVGGDVAVGGGAVSISAPVGGNIKIGGGEVRIDAPVKGSVEILAEKVTLGPKAIIEGDLRYTAKTEATMLEGALVRGQTDFKKRESPAPAAPWTLGAILSLTLGMKLIMSFVGALALFLVFPRYVREFVANFSAKPMENLGMGFVALIVLPVASIIMLLTIIGVPLGVLGLLGLSALLVFASLAAPIAVGSVVHKWIWKPSGYEVNWWIILMGAVVYLLLGLLPFVGWIVKFAIILVTLGVVVGIKWEIAKAWR